MLGLDYANAIIRNIRPRLFIIVAASALAAPPILNAQSRVNQAVLDVARRDTTQEQATITLRAIYQDLRSASPRLHAATALARAARARVPAAGLPPDPQVQLGWMNYELPALKPMEIVGMTQLQVMQMLPLGGKLGLSRSIARSRSDAQSERALDTWWEVRAQAAMPFYELYRVDRSVIVMRETLRLLADVRETAEAMYRVGSANQADVLRAQVEIARMTEDTLRMQAMRSGMAARLNALLDRSQATPVASPVLPIFPGVIPSLDSLIQLAYAARPMLRAGVADLSAAESLERLARKELLPDLQVGVQYAQRRKSGTAGDMTGANGRSAWGAS